MRVRIPALLFAFALLACGRSDTPAPAPPTATPPVSAPAPAAPAARVGAIELGSALGADGRVAAAAQVFAPADTIYVSVLTEGTAPGAELSARWTYEDGQLVSEGRETLASSRSTTQFHIAKPDGWPVGRYRVAIALDGQPAGTRDFEVR
jgi:hypothetical protein